MLTLLIVDRRRTTRRKLHALLETAYRLVSVGSAFSAFRALRRQRPDLVLVKSAARDAYAVAVLKWLALHQMRTPVVVVLESSSARDARIVRELGVRAVLRWPVRAQELLSALASAEGAAGRSDRPAGRARRSGRSSGQAAAFRDRRRAGWYMSSPKRT